MPAAGLLGGTNGWESCRLALQKHQFGTGSLLTSDGIILEKAELLRPGDGHLVPSPGGSDGHIWPRLHVEECGTPLVQAPRTRQANVCFDFWLLQVQIDLTLVCLLAVLCNTFLIPHWGNTLCTLIQIWPWWIIAAIIAAHTRWGISIKYMNTITLRVAKKKCSFSVLAPDEGINCFIV